MILIDANLLVYATVPSLPQHLAANRWLNDQLSGHARVGLPWPALIAFLRVVINARAFRPAHSIQSAWSVVESWLETPNVWIPRPTERHREVFGTVLARLGGGPNLIPDAHLAALAIEHGLTLCSTDGDFARFPGLKWLNPLL